MRKLFMSAVAGALGAIALAAGPAQADVVVLTFEGVGDVADIGDFYNGGTDSAGHSGANYGVSFLNGVGLIDADAGGAGNFANEPSPNTVMYFNAGDNAILNYAAGFSGGFSFFYASVAPASVSVWTGAGGTGTLLGSLDLVGQFQGNGCAGDPGGDFCNWTPVGVSFGGIARSINFGGASGATAFDDITFGSAVAGGDPVSGVPEPSTWATMILGFFGLGSALRLARRRRVAVA